MRSSTMAAKIHRLVWTEVHSWGPSRIEDRRAELWGVPWPKVKPHVTDSLWPNVTDLRYGEIRVFHHLFERVLDAPTYGAVSKTYGRQHTAEEYDALERMIRDAFDNAVVKREDAALYLSCTV